MDLFTRLLPNFYHASVLKFLTVPVGKLIRCDNSTSCATRTNRAQVCVEIDASKDPIPYFWLGIPGMKGSRRQNIIFETLPAYCVVCGCQGHNIKTCRNGQEQQKKMKGGQVWVKKFVKSGGERTQIQDTGMVQGTTSGSKDLVVQEVFDLTTDSGVDEKASEDAKNVAAKLGLSGTHDTGAYPQVQVDNGVQELHGEDDGAVGQHAGQVDKGPVGDMD